MSLRWRLSIASIGIASASAAADPPPARPEYPSQEVLRPITLPAGLSEVAITPHGELDVPLGSTAGWESGTTIHARYGITPQLQLGATYVLEGAYHDPLSAAHELAIHPGAAVGLDATAMIRERLAVKLGVPIYLDPVAVALQFGLPVKLTFGDKLAIGGLDDLLEIKLVRFPPSLYLEGDNALAAANDLHHTRQSRGDLRISGYGIYQQARTVAWIGRLGVAAHDFSTDRDATGYGGVAVSARAGIDWTPRPWLDLGFSLGFDDLRHAGTFGPAGYLGVRI